MHKYVLLDFLAEHDRTTPADSKEPEDRRITHLKEFLATEEIRMMNDNEDISVAKFYEFLGKKYDPKKYDLTPLLITQNLAEFHLVKPGVTYQGIALKAVSTTDTARSKQALRRTQPIYFIDSKTKTVKYTANPEGECKNIPFAAIAGLLEAVKQLDRRSEVLQVDLKPVVDVIEGYHQSTPTFRASKVFDAFLRHEKPAVARKPANAATNSKVLDRKAAIPDKESKQSIKKDWMTVFGGKRLLSSYSRKLCTVIN